VTEPLLDVAGISVGYEMRRELSAMLRRRPAPRLVALDDVSLSVGSNETLGVVGESGSGKSTLAKAIVRLVELDAGTVRFAGRAISGLSGSDLADVRRRVQLVYQDPYSSLNPRLHTDDAITEPAIVHGLAARARRDELARQLLGPCGPASDGRPQEPEGAVRRTTTAGGDRASTGGAARHAARGRGGQRPGRVGTGTDPQPVRRDPAGPGNRDPLHLAPAVGRVARRGQRRRDVPRSHSRVRLRLRGVRGSGAPVHAGAPRLAAGTPPSRRAAAQAGAGRRGALAARHPIGMPVSHALPARAGHLRPRGPGSDRDVRYARVALPRPSAHPQASTLGRTAVPARSDGRGATRSEARAAWPSGGLARSRARGPAPR
jgi:ABC transporter